MPYARSSRLRIDLTLLMPLFFDENRYGFAARQIVPIMGGDGGYDDCNRHDHLLHSQFDSTAASVLCQRGLDVIFTGPITALTKFTMLLWIVAVNSISPT